MTRTDSRRFPVLFAAIVALALAGAALSLLLSPVRAQEGSAPAKPTGLTATASHDQVVLTWEDPQDDSITGYVILRRNRDTDAQGEFTELVNDTGSAATSYTDDSVAAGTPYTYRIKAINGDGVSERSRWFHVDTPSAPVPDQPTGLTATASHDQVVLTWGDPNNDSITGYVILRRNRDTDAEGQFTELVNDTGAAATTYTDDSVAAETAYTYRIKAINAAGVSERSRWFHTDTPAAPAPDTTPEPTNSAATGAPTISGTAQVGEALTADTSRVADADGLENVSFTYQWLADDTAIQGATNSTYILADADEGKAIKVRVSFTDDAGNSESLTSGPTQGVEAAPTPNTPATGAPTISGAPQVGETLKADTSGIADPDGLENVTFSYQWLADAADIPGARESTYTLSEAVEGKTFSVWVSFTDDAGNEETLTSEPTEAVAGNEEPVASEDVVAWSAIMTVEWVYQGYGYYSTDAKKAGSLSPASFKVDGTTYTVKMVETQGWMYIGVDRELPFGFVLELDGMRFASSDASFRAYTYGNIYKWIRTGLSWRDGDAVEVRLLRAFEDETAANTPATGAPSISGTAQVGKTLTADISGIADADGISNATFGYQWLAGDSDISGATASTYILADADEGKTVKVQVSFTDDAGNAESLNSEATDEVAAAPRPNTPATGAPTVTDTVQVGETLTADTTGIADADGLENAAFSYQWLADYDAIAGAMGITYTLADEDEGKAIQVRVSFTDDAGNDETLTSTATDAVAAATQPDNPATGAPTISGTVQVGETLTADTSGISDADGLKNVAYNYQWIRNDGTTDTDIPEATGSSYELSSDDLQKYIKVRVSFTDDAGNQETLAGTATDAVATPQPSERPAVPTGLGATATHDQVVLTWDDPQDDTITGYVILRRNRETAAEGEFTELVGDTGTAATTYTDDSVAAEMHYTYGYGIQAINAGGTSERSHWVFVDTRASPAPTVPPEPLQVATGASQELVVSWETHSGGPLATGYKVQWKSGTEDFNGSATSTRQAMLTDLSTLTYTIDGLTNGTDYTVRVIGYNATGDGPPSAEETAAPEAPNIIVIFVDDLGYNDVSFHPDLHDRRIDERNRLHSKGHRLQRNRRWPAFG